MLRFDRIAKVWHLPLLFSIIVFAIGGVSAVLANRVNSTFKVGEDFVILSVFGLVVLTVVLEIF